MPRRRPGEFLAVKYIQQFTLLTFLVQLVDPAIGQPPLGYLTFPFLYPDVFWFGINMGLLLLLDDLDDHLGWLPIAVIYFLGALVGNLGLFLGGTAFGMAGGSAGVMALFGMFMVRNPYQLALAEFVPAPAFICLVVLILGRLLIFGALDIFPMLVGVGLGLLFKDAAPGQPARTVYR